MELLLACPNNHKVLNFSDFTFSPRSLPWEEMACYTLMMFEDLGLDVLFDVKRETLARWVWLKSMICFSFTCSLDGNTRIWWNKKFVSSECGDQTYLWLFKNSYKFSEHIVLLGPNCWIVNARQHQKAGFCGVGCVWVSLIQLCDFITLLVSYLFS